MIGALNADTLVGPSEGEAQHRTRLAGLDTSEMGQACVRASMNHLSDRVAGRFTVVDWAKRARYGWVVGKLLISSEDICLDQVEAGLALQAVSVRADTSAPAVSPKG